MDSKFTCNIDVKHDESDEKTLNFEIYGGEDYGLNHTIVNAIRRTLLSSIETYAFRNSDIVIETNKTSLHNEIISDRIGLIPLYIDPKLVQDNYYKYLFMLSIKLDNKTPIVLVTAGDINVFELKNTITKSSDYINGLITTVNKDNYDLTKPVSDKIKEEIFRPYKYDSKSYYCLLHELKSTNSDTEVQELVLYGSPSVSISKEDARFQGVSCASYSYKTDPDLFSTVWKKKIQINNIKEEDRKDYIKDLQLKESQRYYHRDKNNEAYWYNFKLESQHYLNAKDLFIRANEIIIDSLEGFKEELNKILDEDEKKLIHMNYNSDEKKKNVINMIVEMPCVIQINNIWHGFDDTLGSIIQAHISNKMINETSALNLVGYKRTHPLENKYLFTMSFNPKHLLGNQDTEEKTKTSAIIQVFSECCDELISIFNTIIVTGSGI